MLVFSFAACSKAQTNNAETTTKQIESQTTTTSTTQSTKEAASETTTEATTKKSNKDKDNSDGKKISMNINGEEVIISLDDTPAANSFYDMLPIDVNFKNFNSEEKMPSVEEVLKNADKPEAPSFDIGDFGLSEEDGSLSVLIKYGEQANIFNKLGTVE